MSRKQYRVASCSSGCDLGHMTRLGLGIQFLAGMGFGIARPAETRGGGFALLVGMAGVWRKIGWEAAAG